MNVNDFNSDFKIRKITNEPQIMLILFRQKQFWHIYTYIYNWLQEKTIEKRKFLKTQKPYQLLSAICSRDQRRRSPFTRSWFGASTEHDELDSKKPAPFQWMIFRFCLIWATNQSPSWKTVMSYGLPALFVFYL